MRQTHSTFLILFFSTLLGGLVSAQPSGGPYGPVPQHYPVPETGKVFYVSPEGNPEATGSSLDEPTSLRHAIIRAQTGDTVVLRGGIYRTGSVYFNQGITLQPYHDEEPVLKGTLLVSSGDWKKAAEGIWKTQWTHLFPAAPADWWRPERHLDTTPLHRFNYDMVFADDQRLESAGSIEEVSENSYYIDYENGWVFIGRNPAETSIEITAHDSALVRTMRRVHNRDNDGIGPTIRGITFTRYARLALLVEGVEPGRPMDASEFGKDVVGTTIENVTISHCSRVAGYFRGDDLTIRQSLIADCATEGIYVINSANVLLERNIITRTNSHTPIMGYYASAIKIFNQSHYVVVRDNVIIDNPHASGIWYDVGNNHGLVVNNWVENTNDGFFFEISEGAICAGNVFVNASPGVRILNSADVAVYQNTFYNSPLQVIRTMRSSAAGDHFGWHESAGPSVAQRDRHIALNNLFIADEQFPYALVQYWEAEGVDAVAEAEQIKMLDGNVYVRTSSGKPLISWGLATFPPTQDSAQSVYTMSGIRSEKPGFEQGGAAFVGYRWPVVRSPELKRFELMATFPGAQVGVQIPSTVLEAVGWELETSPFPGAYPAE